MSEQLFFSKLVTKSLQPIAGNDRFFEGYLTVEVKDKQGEVTIVDELIKVLPIWMDRGAPITDTHSNRVIGKGINYQKTIYKAVNGKEYPAIKIIGKIHSNYELDNEIWNRITTGEYKGLSFGGATKSARTPFRMKDGTIAYSLKDLEHYEVAVCKDPAVPLALITDFNHIAKAMTDNYTTHSEGKMLIRCSNFGCVVEKTDDKKEEVEITKGGIEIGCPNGECDYKQVSKDPNTPHHKFCPKCGTNMKIDDLKKDSLVKIEDEKDKNTKVEVLDEWENETNPKNDDDEDEERKIGMKVETEFTDDNKEAEDSVENHLKKDPKHYSRLRDVLRADEEEKEQFAIKERKALSSKKLGSGKDVDNSLLHKTESSYITKPIPDGKGGKGEFEHCESVNQDKDDPSAYCGAIQHNLEKGEKIGNITNENKPKVDKTLQKEILDESVKADAITMLQGMRGIGSDIDKHPEDSQQVTSKKKPNKLVKSYKSAENYINILIKDLHKDMVEEISKEEHSSKDEKDEDEDDKSEEKDAKKSFREAIKTNFETMTEVIQSLAETQKSVSESLKSVDTRLKALETPTDLPLKPKESDSEDIGAKVKVPDTYQSNSVQADLGADGKDSENDKNSLSMQEKTHTTGTPRPNAGIENVNKTFSQDYNPILKDARAGGDLSQVARDILRGKYYTPNEQEAWY